MEPMHTDTAAEETTAEATVDEAAKATAGEEAAETAGAGNLANDEAAGAAAAEADKEPDDRTDGTEAAGAPGAMPTTEPSATAAASTSDEPQLGVYLKAGEGIYVNLPWASSSRAPIEGEVFDGEILAAAGLKLVDTPSTSSNTSEEEQLLQKLVSLYRARQEKLVSREALVVKAGTNIEKRAEELQSFHQEALQSLAKERAHLVEEQKAFLLTKAEIEEQQRVVTEKLSAQEGQLTQRKVDLDSHEEDLAAREAALVATLHRKDEEVSKLVAERTQEQEQKHKEEAEALVKNFSDNLKQATDAAAAAETARKELEIKVARLEANLEANGKELSALKLDREKALYSLSEMQVTIAEKGKQLSAANDSIKDLTLKLTTLTETLEGARKRELALEKEIQDERALLQSTATAQNTFRSNVTLWTEALVNTAADIDKELTKMGVEDFGFPTDEKLQPSAKLSLFFKGIVAALKKLQDNYPAQLADEARRLCEGALRKLLMKVAYRNPGLNLTNVLRSLPKDADLEALEALVAPIVDKVSKIQRVEGDHRD